MCHGRENKWKCCLDGSNILIVRLIRFVEIINSYFFEEWFQIILENIMLKIVGEYSGQL